MNREILFRGKSMIDGNWIYGFLNYAEQEKKYYIGVMELMTPVIPETVGQFTGLTDKNGVKIFEGDATEGFEYIVFYNGIFGTTYQLNCQGVVGLSQKISKYMRIIGNIHDNKF